VIAGYEHDLSVVYEAREECEEAGEHLERAVRIMEEKLPAEHPDLGTASHSLARVLARLDRGEEAVPYLARAIRIAEQTRRPLKVASRSRELAAVFKGLGRGEEARRQLEVARAVYAGLAPEQAEEHAVAIRELDRELAELD
jgi:tetratricopeptide (TPR) repeat protein